MTTRPRYRIGNAKLGDEIPLEYNYKHSYDEREHKQYLIIRQAIEKLPSFTAYHFTHEEMNDLQELLHRYSAFLEACRMVDKDYERFEEIDG